MLLEQRFFSRAKRLRLLSFLDGQMLLEHSAYVSSAVVASASGRFSRICSREACYLKRSICTRHKYLFHTYEGVAKRFSLWLSSIANWIGVSNVRHEKGIHQLNTNLTNDHSLILEWFRFPLKSLTLTANLGRMSRHLKYSNILQLVPFHS